MFSNGFMQGLLKKFLNTVIPEIFALLIFAHLIFAVIYYLQFQEAGNIRCSKNVLKLNFRVLHFSRFLSTTNY